MIAAAPPAGKVVLHAGAGPRGQDNLRKVFDESWTEIRLDIDPAVDPDMVASIATIPLESESVDAVYCSHTLEHLPYHEAIRAAGEFRRVLRPRGRLVLIVPDLGRAIAHAAERGPWSVAYECGAGPITPYDMIFGLTWAITGGNAHMAHRSGYTREMLVQVCKHAGFASASIESSEWSLWCVAER